MNIEKYKTKRVIQRFNGLLAFLLVMALGWFPSTALAASAKYAIQCASSNVVVHAHSVSCSATPAVPKLEGIGGPKNPLPSGTGVTVVTVDCGHSSPITPSFNGTVALKCHHGTPTIKNPQVIQSYTPPGGGGPPAPPGGPGPSSPSSCSDGNCDLIDTYVNPLINLLSVIFGLVAVGSLIMGGIQYTASEGDPQKISKAKNRLTNTVLAIFAYSVLYGFLQFLVPGGLFQ